jgi:hypothetical protein
VENLATYGKKLVDLPFVLQYNKRDLKQILPVREMDAQLNPRNVPVVEGIAKDGVGVSETLVTISRMVFSHLRKTLLMPGDAAEHDEIGKLADAKIGESFRPQDAEPLEEISDIEEIQETREAPPAAEEPAFPPPAVEEPVVPGRGLLEGLDEIEVEISPVAPAPPAAKESRAGISLETEEGGLTFLKFENPYLTPEGHAVLPAMFMDVRGNVVRLRIRITMEEQA